MIDEFKMSMGKLLFDYPCDAGYSFEDKNQIIQRKNERTESIVLYT